MGREILAGLLGPGPSAAVDELELLLLLLLGLGLGPWPPPTKAMALRKAMMTCPSLRPITIPWSASILPGSSRNFMMGAPSAVKPRNLAVNSASSFSLSSARRVCLWCVAAWSATHPPLVISGL
jgi:hypothetical protein